MKNLLVILFCVMSFTSVAQLQKFLIEAQVVDTKGDPISDVYIVNLNSQEKDISLSNGVFTIWVTPVDSVVLSHISYFRKIVSVHKLLVNPKVVLVSENVDIEEITVTPDQLTDEDRANINMAFINRYNPPVRARIAESQSEPLPSIMIEHNDLMRSEASSISIFRFSPSKNIKTLFHGLKRTDTSTDYFYTKKQKDEVKVKK